MLAAGTAAALVPVKSITMRSRGDTFKYCGYDGELGPAFKKLLQTLKDIQLGKKNNEFGWLELVQEPREG